MIGAIIRDPPGPLTEAKANRLGIEARHLPIKSNVKIGKCSAHIANHACLLRRVRSSIAELHASARDPAIATHGHVVGGRVQDAHEQALPGRQRRRRGDEGEAEEDAHGHVGQTTGIDQ